MSSASGKWVPGLFVLLWSTGFIGAKLGLPFAEPMTFLALRFGMVAVAMALIALFSGAIWPRGWRMIGHVAIVGLLMQTIYLGGVFIGIAHGVPAGLSALIVGLQPLLTAALAGLVLGERVRGVQWLGLALGCVGVALVVGAPLLGAAPLDAREAMSGERLHALGLTCIALIGITLGTLYQKKFCTGVDLRAAVAIQNLAGAASLLPLAFAFETMHITWNTDFVIALTWLCLVLSVGAAMLLLLLVRHGAAAKVASLFYLVPPVTTLIAFLIFGETLTPLAATGMACAVAGVAVVNLS
ncbi:MAG TPA: DMT family transporter [Stellaceae bacterium]|nr:DMT family transporter [Stellaceae bacterium]